MSFLICLIFCHTIVHSYIRTRLTPVLERRNKVTLCIVTHERVIFTRALQVQRFLFDFLRIVQSFVIWFNIRF